MSGDLYLEGFDDGLWADFLAQSGTVNVGSSYGNQGNGMEVGDTVAGYVNIPIPNAASGHFIVGFDLNMQTPSNGLYVMNFSTGGRVNWNANRVHLYNQGSATGNINWYSDTLALDEWHYVEIEMKYGGSSDGTLRFWVDGALVDETTTHDFAYGNFSSIQFGSTNSQAPDKQWMDNIYILDNTGDAYGALGPIEVVPLLPNGNGNSSDLLGSDGNSTDNYQQVDENPPNETDYNGSSTEGDQDTYAFDDLTGTPTVKGLTVRANAVKTEVGAKFIRPVVRSGGTDYTGDSSALATSYGGFDWDFFDDPDTATDWLYGGVNSAEFGIEVRDS